jgi:hypothetical protein
MSVSCPHVCREVGFHQLKHKQQALRFAEWIEQSHQIPVRELPENADFAEAVIFYSFLTSPVILNGHKLMADAASAKHAALWIQEQQHLMKVRSGLGDFVRHPFGKWRLPLRHRKHAQLITASRVAHYIPMMVFLATDHDLPDQAPRFPNI